ncbi:MAG: TIGR03364 family FAD-dependent oxidoreductase [Bacteroidia bacterium]|nr:TIGR03364 family FAD-dependent oxidoreductase [Bacteroidia bacterium]
MHPEFQTDTVIIGAGIVGLALAYTHAREGRRVTVFEREARPVGASIRNFGMVWPIGQPAGPLLRRALRSREIWEQVAVSAGIWHEPLGSLHLAYREDEWAVMEEFAAASAEQGYACELLSPAQTLELSAAAHPEGLLGSLWSRTEMIVDAREVPSKLIPWLQETYGVEFRFGTAVTRIGEGRIGTAAGTWRFDTAWVCSGADFETLFPEVFADSGLTKCKLQMMRTAPQPGGWRMGPALCGGLTLTHYASFASCATLPALKARIRTETPWFPEWGIHVMMSQNGLGELVIGDTHEYGPTHDPFLREELNQYILDYLAGMARMPDAQIAERWYGVYAKSTRGGSEFLAHPLPGVTVVTGVGGAGMTMSFGLAEELVQGS